MVDEDDSNEWEETQYESLDWGEEDRSQSRLIEVYHSTNKAAQAALVLIVAGIVLLGTAMSLNGILSDDEKAAGLTVKTNEIMDTTGLEVDEEGGDIDEDFVRQVLRGGLFYELGCAVLAFIGSASLIRRQNYNMVLIGCTAAIIGLGGFLLSTITGAIALYLTFQCKHEFGINEQDESW